jgi:hypothetical protein
MTPDDNKHLSDVLRHIQNVRESCALLGHRLIERGEAEVGLQLIAQGLVHDTSKIVCAIEFKYLRPVFFGSDEFNLAFKNHVGLNLHHPEAWQGIKDMPRRFKAEMVCDWHARSSEFGNDLLGWIKDRATEKFQFTTHDKVYKEIKDLVGTLCDKAF